MFTVQPSVSIFVKLVKAFLWDPKLLVTLTSPQHELGLESTKGRLLEEGACNRAGLQIFPFPSLGEQAAPEAHIMDSLCGTWLENRIDKESQTNHSRDL